MQTPAHEILVYLRKTDMQVMSATRQANLRFTLNPRKAYDSVVLGPSPIFMYLVFLAQRIQSPEKLQPLPPQARKDQTSPHNWPENGEAENSLSPTPFLPTKNSGPSASCPGTG